MGMVMLGHEDEAGASNGKKTTLLPRTPATILGRLKKAIIKEQRLLIAVLAAVVLLNIPFGRVLLYPFMLFSTWIHEMCHGVAALIVGGSIDELIIYRDGSGLAYTSLPDDNWYIFRRVIVASAGYVGTSLVGGFLLVFRRTRRGPRIGVITLAFMIILSCMMYVRNFFGLLVLIPSGVSLLAAGWFLPDAAIGALYTFLAVTCCLNAVLSIHELFGSDEWTVGGEPAQTDAHTVSEYMYWPYWFIAAIWFVMAILSCLAGLIFGLNPSEAPEDSTPLPPPVVPHTKSEDGEMA